MRYGDLLVDNRKFSLPLSFTAIGRGYAFGVSRKALRIPVAESFADLTVKIS